MATQNPLSTVAPLAPIEYLSVSIRKANWLAGTAVTRMAYRYPSILDQNVMVDIKYTGLSMYTPEPNYSLIAQECDSVLLWCGLEAVGRVINVGSDVTTLQMGDYVLCFDPMSKGHLTEISVPATKAFRIPTLDPKYLSAGSPMLVSDIVYNQFLAHLQPRSSILINDGGSGVGLSLAQEGAKRNFRVHPITYTQEGYARACQFSTNAIVYIRSGLHGRRTEPRMVCQDPLGYDAILTSAILSPDVREIYKLFCSLLKKFKGFLVVLCTSSLVAEASKYIPHDLLAARGVSLCWVTLDVAANCNDYTAKIGASITKLDTGNSLHVLAERPIGEVLSARATQRALTNSFGGKSTGQQYTQLQ